MSKLENKGQQRLKNYFISAIKLTCSLIAKQNNSFRCFYTLILIFNQDRLSLNNQVSSMSSFVESVSLFPETRFWKMGKKSEINNFFGGCATLLLLIIIVAVFGFKLKEVFSRTKITATSMDMYEQTHQVNFNTQINNRFSKPLMILVYFSTGNLNLTMRHSESKDNIVLEKCTSEHFTDFGNVYTSQDLNNTLCLPLNQAYPLDRQNKFFQISIFCSFPGLCSYIDIATINFFYPIPQLFATTQDPWTYTTQTFKYLYEEKYKLSQIYMSQEKIITDQSLFPFQSNVQNTSGLRPILDPNSLSVSTPLNIGMLSLIIYGQRNYKVHNRYFLKVLDALSYIGGIFNSLIVCFFFMKMYGELFFEMGFAGKFFRKKESRNFGFFSFLKQSTYSVLCKVGLKPDWDISEKRQQLRESVGNLMDVINLQRRIEYLQTAITLIIEPHHRRGLQLIRKKRKDVDAQCLKHSFRDSLIAFFRKRELRPSFFQEDPQKRKIEKFQSPGQQQQLDIVPQVTAKNTQKQLMNREPINSSQGIMSQPNPPKTSNPVEEEEDVFVFEALAEEHLDTDPFEIQAEIFNDLKRLLEQAESSKDMRSRMIVDLIDDRMKQWLKGIMVENKDYRFKFNLAQQV